MAIGIDTSKWKPRKMNGTPAAKVRNIIATSIVSFGLLTGIFFHFSKYTLNLRNAVEVLYEDPIEEVERKQMIAKGLPTRTPATLRKYIEESQRPDLPDK